MKQIKKPLQKEKKKQKNSIFFDEASPMHVNAEGFSPWMRGGFFLKNLTQNMKQN